MNDLYVIMQRKAPYAMYMRQVFVTIEQQLYYCQLLHLVKIPPR